jgi:hypothetical protein
MTRDDIIRMAREAGMEQDGDNFFSPSHEEIDVHITDLERFAALVAAAERERFYGEDKPDSCVKGCPVGQVCDYCQIIKPVQEQIAKAVSAEREACITDIKWHVPRAGRHMTEYQMAEKMIARIRARGQA